MTFKNLKNNLLEKYKNLIDFSKKLHNISININIKLYYNK